VNLLFYYAACVVVFTATWWLQRREARRHFVPLLLRLRNLYAELGSAGSPEDSRDQI
jgi:hypothetical protein